MDRLSIFLTLAVGAAITGTLVILVLILGWYSWPAIVVAALVGFLLTWPASYLISRRIKRQDPNWDASKGDKAQRGMPDTSAPEA